MSDQFLPAVLTHRNNNDDEIHLNNGEMALSSSNVQWANAPVVDDVHFDVMTDKNL